MTLDYMIVQFINERIEMSILFESLLSIIIIFTW